MKHYCTVCSRASEDHESIYNDDGVLCDNPKCVRPSHLFVGTAQDNTDDKVQKGRHILQRSSILSA